MKKIKKSIFDNKYIYISFTITFLFVVSVYVLYEMYPFGDKCILWYDLAAQYAPFFTELYDRVVESKSLIYSFSSGLGLPFLGNFYNYLSTPFLGLIFVFGRKYIPEAIALMILLKSSLSAATFSYFLKRSQNSNCIFTSVFGVLYALSGWFVAYYFNIMWLDAVVLLPLVTFGIEKIINTNKPYVYIVFLTLTLITNYYMGYMVCIFSVIYYFVYYFSNYTIKSESEGKIKNLFVNRSVSFGISSLCCGALSAFVLVPVFVILQGCSATSESWPQKMELYFNFWNFFKNHFVDAMPTFENDYSIPNIYCGILSIIFLLAYFFSKGIKFKEKIIIFCVLLFFYFSFNFNYLDYIWHAFHFPNDIPYRFSYMYCFIILTIANKSAKRADSIPIQYIVLSSIVTVILILLTYFLGDGVSEQSFLFSIIFFGIYLFLILLQKIPGVKKYVSLFLTITVVCEIALADSGNFQIYLPKNQYMEKYEDIADLNSQIGQKDDECFFREELTSNSIYNGGCEYRYNGISAFSSMAYENVAKLQDKIGNRSNEINNYIYCEQTPVYDMMHATKFRLSTVESKYFTKVYNSEELSIYKNNYYLPLGFCVNTDIIDWNIENNNPFRVQGDWLKCASRAEDVYCPLKGLRVTSEELNIAKYDNDSHSVVYIKSADVSDSTVTVTFVADNDGECYSYAESKDIHGTGYIKHEGKVKKGEKVTVSAQINENFDDEGKIVVCAYTVNEEALNKGYEKLKSQVMTIDTFDETYIKGGVTAKEDCVLYTSIPFDKGWTVSIDGKEINEDDYIALGNAYLCFNISQGDHTVEFSFRQRGLKEGISISVITLVSLIVYAVIKKKK